MKKAISLIIALALCVCLSGVALAEDLSGLSGEELYQLYGNVVREMLNRSASTHTEPGTDALILFRGIPWGTDGKTFVSTLKESGINGGLKAGDCRSWNRQPFGGFVPAETTLKNGGYVYTSNPGSLIVAGYPVSTIEAWFMHSFDDETVYDTPERSELYYACYEFEDVLDKRAGYESLLGKLTALYGEPEILSGSNHGWEETTYCDQAFWYGADSTALMLMHYYRVSDDNGKITYDSLSLDYGLADSTQRLNALEAAFAREELERVIESDSVDGL